MAMNIKDPQTEALAAEVAALANETKTQAVRTALQERKERLQARKRRHARTQRLDRFLEDEAWPQIPDAVLGRPLPKAEREAIVDSSAIVAILLKEPGYERLRDHVAVAKQVSAGAPTVLESSLVLCSRLGHAGKTLLARFLQEAEIEVVDFVADHWMVAADAFLAYGKGRHRAGLSRG